MCVEISGIPEAEDENTKEIVIKIGSSIVVDITESDLSVGHRLPKQSYRDVVREGSFANFSRFRAPNIVVKFVQRELRDRFYKVRKFLRDKTTEDLDLGLNSDNKMYISENLTQIKKDLVKDSLKVKRDLKYKHIWTFYGRIYLRRDSQSLAVTITRNRIWMS